MGDPTTTSPASTTASRRGSGSSSTAGSSTGTAAPSRARSSRCGRPTPPAATRTTATSIPRRSTRTSRGPAAASPTTRGATGSSPSSPGAYPVAEPRERLATGAHPLLAVRPRFAQRLVTQMYFPGDPLFAIDPIFNSIPDPKARERLVARFDLSETVPEWALAFRLDIVLRGSTATPIEDEDDDGEPVREHLADGRAVSSRSGCRGPMGPTSSPRERPARSGCGAGARRRRRAGPRRARRDVAGGPDGRFDHPDDREGAVEPGSAASGAACRRDGAYAILTVKPGAVPGSTDLQAPHIDVSVFARGLLKHLVTRIYSRMSRRRTPRTPSRRRSSIPRPATTLIGGADGRRIRVRHPAAGRR